MSLSYDDYIAKGWKHEEAEIMLGRKPEALPFKWTDTNTKLALRLDAKGYSCREIADEIGTTRSSVISKLNRLKKAGKKARPAKPKTVPKIPRPKSKVQVLRSLSRDETGDGMALVDLRDDQCHWIPTRHTGRHHKPYTCDGTKAPGKQLCQHHHDRAHIKIKPRSVSRKDVVLDRRQA